MGKEIIEKTGNLDDYFWYWKAKELSPLVIEGRPAGADLYRIVVRDAHGVEITDSQELGLKEYRKEAGLLAKSLRAKSYEVSVAGLEPVA